MIFRFVTQAGEPAECELFIGQIGQRQALMFVQAPDAHPIKNEIASLVEQALDQHFDHLSMQKIDVRVFVHYPSSDCHKNVCMEVFLDIRHRSFIERAILRPKGRWAAHNHQLVKIGHSSAIYIYLMWILSVQTGT
jgi:hypothetical protein